MRGIEGRTIRVSASPHAVRDVVRARRVRARDGIPGVWLGKEAPTGIAGWIFFWRLVFLQPVPPGCTLYNGRAWRLPVVWGTITRDRDRGSKVQMMIVPPGFPMSRSPDPIAVALFDEWLGGIVTELEGG